MLNQLTILWFQQQQNVKKTNYCNFRDAQSVRKTASAVNERIRKNETHQHAKRASSFGAAAAATARLQDAIKEIQKEA